MLEIRDYQPEDLIAVAAVWHRSGLDEYSYLPDFQTLSVQRAQEVFNSVILPGAQLHVAWMDDVVAGFMALRGSYIDRLYVDPPAQQQGVGTRLMAQAKLSYPQGLELHTHQQNTRARAFYEKHGFRAVKFGISPAPERMPDVEYHWRPDAA